MKHKISFAVIVFLLGISLVFVNFNFHVRAEAREIYVSSEYKGFSDGSADRPYKSIQEAIDIADEGDILYVFGGLYQENLIIDKKIKIWGGIDEVETVIDSRFDVRYVLEVTADEVELEGLTVSDADSKTSSPIGALICLKSSGNRIISNFVGDTDSYGIYVAANSNDNLISKNDINNTGRGIYISSASTTDVIDNKITNCSHSGVYIESALSNNRLYGNNIDRCDTGIYVKNSDSVNITSNTISNSTHSGLSLYNSDESLIRHNHFYYNSGQAVFLSSSSCVVFNNTFEYNQRGITLAASGNTIENNTIHNSYASGIFAQSNSNNNRIYLNSFKNNDPSAIDQGLNNWHYENQGNYWSDYDYVDRDDDGIGDEPYLKEGVYDIYPLGYFIQPPYVPSDPSPEDLEEDVGLRVTLQVQVEDPADRDLTVYFYKEDDTLIDSIQNPVKKVKSNSVASCSFTLGFNTTYAWYAVVNNSFLENRSDTFIFYTSKTPPDNNPPVAKISGPYYAKTNQPINFNSTGSHDPDGEIDFYRWNFGDGSSEIIHQNPTYTYSQPGQYTVTLTVIDNDGSSKSDTTTVFISETENRPPVANAVIPPEGTVGESITFSSQGTSDPDGDDLTYSWDFGDGGASTNKNPTYIYESTGTYFITLEVSDYEFSDTMTAEITIRKAAEETPGFELLLVLIGLLSILFIKKHIIKI